MLLTRRHVVTGTGAIALAAIFARFPGARFVRAQGAAYDLVDLYAFVDAIEPEGGFKTTGFGASLTESGEVGGSIVANGKLSPAVWAEPGRPTLLKSGKFGGYVRAINADGIAVGAELNETGASARPIIWRNGKKATLSLPDGAGGKITGGAANDINADGVAVGSASTGDRSFALRWTGDRAEELAGVDGGVAHVVAINADGVAAGTVSVAFQDGNTSGTISQPAVWRDASPTVLDRPEDAAPMDNLVVTDVNASGLVLVYLNSFENVGESASFILDSEGGAPTPLQALDRAFTTNSAVAFNDEGAAVGFAREPEKTSVAVIWIDGEPQDLRELAPADSGIELTNAQDINNEGVILCRGVDSDDVTHAVLLVPAS